MAPAAATAQGRLLSSDSPSIGTHSPEHQSVYYSTNSRTISRPDRPSSKRRHGRFAERRQRVGIGVVAGARVHIRGRQIVGSPRIFLAKLGRSRSRGLMVSPWCLRACRVPTDGSTMRSATFHGGSRRGRLSELRCSSGQRVAGTRPHPTGGTPPHAPRAFISLPPSRVFQAV